MHLWTHICVSRNGDLKWPCQHPFYADPEAKPTPHSLKTTPRSYWPIVVDQELYICWSPNVSKGNLYLLVIYPGLEPENKHLWTMRDLSRGFWDPYSTPQLPLKDQPWRPFILRGKDTCESTIVDELFYLVALTTYWLPKSCRDPYHGIFVKEHVMNIWKQVKKVQRQGIQDFLTKFSDEDRTFLLRYMPEAPESCPKELFKSSPFAVALSLLNTLRDYLADARAWQSWSIAVT